MDDIVRPYAGFAANGAVSLSVDRSRTNDFTYFEGHLGADGAAMVRTMPNTPAAVGRGITAACANGHVSSVAARGL
jgi:pyrroline-5-carboxylate reductase